MATEINRSDKRLKIIFTGNIGQAQDFNSLIKCAKILQNKNTSLIKDINNLNNLFNFPYIIYILGKDIYSTF